MKAKKRAASANAIEQAELILKLYELRRETVMREARSYVGGEFLLFIGGKPDAMTGIAMPAYRSRLPAFDYYVGKLFPALQITHFKTKQAIDRHIDKGLTAVDGKGPDIILKRPDLPGEFMFCRIGNI